MYEVTIAKDYNQITVESLFWDTSNQGTQILVPEKCHNIIFVSVTYIEQTPSLRETGHYFWVRKPFRGHLLALKK